MSLQGEGSGGGGGGGGLESVISRFSSHLGRAVSVLNPENFVLFLNYLLIVQNLTVFHRTSGTGLDPCLV